MAVQNELIPTCFLADRGCPGGPKANNVGELKKILGFLPDTMPLGKPHQGGDGGPYKLVVYNNSDAAATEPYVAIEDASYD